MNFLRYSFALLKFDFKIFKEFTHTDLHTKTGELQH